jgi:PAS domain S-box-containing protein
VHTPSHRPACPIDGRGGRGILGEAMAELGYGPVRGLPTESGWPALFWDAFRQSRNPMGLLDARRAHVDVNGAYLKLLGYERRELIGQPVYRFVADGPLMTERQWREALKRKQFQGAAELMCRGGTRVKVEFAAHPEMVTGRQLVLLVALRTTRSTRRVQPHPSAVTSGLTPRELDVIGLIALGLSGPEIADELHLAHDTVRTHARNAMGKLGARSRAHLVAMSMASGTLHYPAIS